MSTLPDQARCHALYRQMLRIRRFEERCGELYKQQKIRGFLHLYIGEEAIATGVIDRLEPRDVISATYREHGHALVRGVSMRAIMAEMYGKVAGCSRGRGGSMHLFDVQRGFLGGHAIVGAGLPIAVGLAMARKRLDQGAISVCFFGEGAAAEGEFHEALNLAALWELPVLFVCENNGYAMGTALARSESQTDIHLKAQAYKIRAEVVDGMDVLAVDEAAQRAISAIRADLKPYFLECRTYRFRPHSMFDPELYREQAEVSEWKKKDPLLTFRAQCETAGLLDEAAVQAMEQEIASEIEDAVQFSEQAEWEAESDLLKDVYTPRGAP
ncbi:MAG: pyruvate dehydrogenase (acetyl-transferring) E1 component subunit alpha [Planctomycetota bacterium]|nr:pyruvate dehydrogenase (acetyl-transferring) E1 component subunit alpha [Planctomycetota bacterium]